MKTEEIKSRITALKAEHESCVNWSGIDISYETFLEYKVINLIKPAVWFKPSEVKMPGVYWLVDLLLKIDEEELLPYERTIVIRNNSDNVLYTILRKERIFLKDLEDEIFRLSGPIVLPVYKIKK